MHQRTFARVAPERAKIFFYRLPAISSFLVVASRRCASVARPALREAKRSSNGPIRSKCLRAAAASSIATETCSCVRCRRESVYAVPHDLTIPDATIAQTRDRSSASSIPRPSRATARQASCSSSGSRARSRTIVAERVRALNFDGIDLKEEDTGGATIPSGHSHRRSWASSASTRTGSTASNTRSTISCRHVGPHDARDRSNSGAPIPFGDTRVVKPREARLDRSRSRSIRTCNTMPNARCANKLQPSTRKTDARSSWIRTPAKCSRWRTYRTTIPTSSGNSPPTRAATARSWTPTSRARRTSSSRPLPRSRAAKSPRATRFPSRDRSKSAGRTIHNAEDGLMAGTGGSETLEDRSSSIRSTSARPKSAMCDRQRKRSTTWNQRRFRRSNRVGSARRESRHRAGAGGLERAVAGDDVVRPRRFGDADRDGALLLCDCERRHA